MAGPWEQYQTPTATPEAAPWLAYQGQAAQQGDRGYAPAPPKPPAPGAWMSDYHEAGTDNTDIAPREAHFPGPPANEPPPPRWQEDNPTFAVGDPQQALPPTSFDAGKVAGAVAQGWREAPSLLPPGSDETGQERLWGPHIGGAINTLYRLPFGIPNALTYGAAEFANQVTGDPRIGRDVKAAIDISPMAAHGFAGPRVFLEPAQAPRVSPMLEGNPRFVGERFAPDVSELDPRNAIQTLIQHDITENPPPAPDRGAPNQTRAAPLMEGFNQAEPPPVAAPPPIPGTPWCSRAAR